MTLEVVGTVISFIRGIATELHPYYKSFYPAIRLPLEYL
jgi:hypothetical protein